MNTSKLALLILILLFLVIACEAYQRDWKILVVDADDTIVETHWCDDWEARWEPYRIHCAIHSGISYDITPDADQRILVERHVETTPVIR